MARKTIPAAEAADVELNHEALAQAGAAATELVLLEEQQQTRVRAVALSVGYQLDTTDPDLIQRDISANMRRSVEACLEVGRGLRVLKEACGHGNFLARLDVLGIDPGVAQKFMQSATKFSNASSTRHLVASAAGNQTKLFELLVLDDEQISELELIGQTGELALDDVATMSVKELRAAVREAKEAAKAKDAIIAKDSTTITELREKLERPFKPKKSNPAKTAEDAAALEELFQRVLATNLEVSRLAVVVRDLQGHESEAMRERALEGMRHVVMSLREIVDEHGLDVDTSADAVGGRPSWLDVDAINAASKKA